MLKGVNGSGLSWWPLFWQHNDSWVIHETDGDGNETSRRYHWGHVHLFMLGFNVDPNATVADAFNGVQRFRFSLIDTWGPRSLDPNQSLPYRVVGLPKWYFNVQELWRRVYVQNWDEKVQIQDPSVWIGRRGIRWDASPADMTRGPFREGNGYSPYWIEGARTLPVEYFTNPDKARTHRDNFVRDRAKAMTDQWNELAGVPGQVPHVIGAKPWSEDDWSLNWPGDVYTDHTYPSGAFKDTYLDSLYIQPIIEYQLVTQLDWDRMPGAAAANDLDDWTTGERFGDGWEMEVTVPFTDPRTGRYNSPFGSRTGECRAPGPNGYPSSNAKGDPLVPADRRLTYRTRQDGPPKDGAAGGYDLVNEPFGLPAFRQHDPAWLSQGIDLPADFRQNLSGQPMQFSNPYPDHKDGLWVQQCLGGIVQARAEIMIEHKLGGRQVVTVNATQYLSNDTFAGQDQLTLNGGGGSSS